MKRGEAALQYPPRRAVGVAVAVLAGAWCLPAVASSGVSLHCDQAAATGPAAELTPTPSLAAHTESAMQEILESEAVQVPTLADATVESAVDDVEDSDTADEAVTRRTETPPVVTTRLPGVSEAILPSFRRQMYRTDI